MNKPIKKIWMNLMHTHVMPYYLTGILSTLIKFNSPLYHFSFSRSNFSTEIYSILILNITLFSIFLTLLKRYTIKYTNSFKFFVKKFEIIFLRKHKKRIFFHNQLWTIYWHINQMSFNSITLFSSITNRL